MVLSIPSSHFFMSSCICNTAPAQPYAIAMYPALYILLMQLVFHLLHSDDHSGHLIVPVEMANQGAENEDEEDDDNDDNDPEADR